MKWLPFILVFLLLFGCGQQPTKEAINNEPLTILKPERNLDFIIECYFNPNDDFIMVVAHRGDWRNFPENSILAIRSAIKLGVDMVEIDIRKTKDGRFVLMHDPTIDRTTTGTGDITEITFEELQSLQLLSGIGVPTDSKVPTLREALLECKDKIMVNLDKAEDYLDEIYPILVETGTLNQVVLKGHHDHEEFKSIFGDKSQNIVYMPLVSEKIEDIPSYVTGLEASIDPSAYEVVFKQKEMESFKYIPEMKRNGDNVWINTLYPRLADGKTDDKAYWDPEANWGWVIQQGATIIQTDRPRELIEYLESLGKH